MAFLYGIRLRNKIVTINLDTLIVLHTLLFRQGCNIDNLLQFFKYRFFRLKRQSLQRFHILQYINPTFKICLTIFFVFCKRRQFKEHKPQFVREHAVSVTVGQHDIRTQLPRRIVQPEIHEKHAIDSFQIEHPVHTLLPLFGNCARQIIQSPLLEILLAAVLHLHDELLTAFRRAVHIINAATVAHFFRQHFLVKKMNVGNMLLSDQKVIKEIDKQVLVDFLSENHLEPHIGERIDELCHNSRSLSLSHHKDSKSGRKNKLISIFYP